MPLLADSQFIEDVNHRAIRCCGHRVDDHRLLRSGGQDWPEVGNQRREGQRPAVDGEPAVGTDLDEDRLELEPPTVVPLPVELRSLGFDVVSKSVSDGFECSPLSCNSMALELAVNRHCLVDHLEVAIAVATRFSVEEPEPGPYYVVEVLRCPLPRGSVASRRDP